MDPHLTGPEHQITPPPELRRLWAQQAQRMDPWDSVAWLQHVSTQAARWGADQELEACIEWLWKHQYDIASVSIRAARRPKPPSLAEQALALINHDPDNQPFLSEKGIAILRRALERLQELEEGNG